MMPSLHWRRSARRRCWRRTTVWCFLYGEHSSGGLTEDSSLSETSCSRNWLLPVRHDYALGCPSSVQRTPVLLQKQDSRSTDPQSTLPAPSSSSFPKEQFPTHSPRELLFFTDEYPTLLGLFTDAFARTLPREVDMQDEQVICFKRLLFDEIERLCNPNSVYELDELDGLVNQMQKEALVFLKLHRKRRGTSLNQFLDQYRDEVGLIAEKFQELFSLHTPLLKERSLFRDAFFSHDETSWASPLSRVWWRSRSIACW